MEIVIEKQERMIKPRQVYLSTFGQAQESNTMMVIEDRVRKAVHERFSLLDLRTGQVILEWTSEGAVENYLVQQAYLLVPPDGVELKIRIPR